MQVQFLLIPQAAAQPAPFDKGAIKPAFTKGGWRGEAVTGGLLS